jgi:hypothetical protein
LFSDGFEHCIVKPEAMLYSTSNESHNNTSWHLYREGGTRTTTSAAPAATIATGRFAHSINTAREASGRLYTSIDADFSSKNGHDKSFQSSIALFTVVKGMYIFHQWAMNNSWWGKLIDN